MIMRSNEAKMTTVGLNDPAPGRYQIRVLQTSATGQLRDPGVVKVATALDPPDYDVKADFGGPPALARTAQASTATSPTVTRTLRYDILRRPNQTITFLDGGTILGEVTGGGRGRLKVTLAADGQVHRIVARAALNGIPVPGEERVVARIRAPKPMPLGRPSRVRVARRGSTLTIGWGATPGASRYSVVVQERGGTTRTILTRARRVRVRGVPRVRNGSVSVRGVDETTTSGPPRSAVFRASAKAKNRFLPYSVLTRRTTTRP